MIPVLPDARVRATLQAEDWEQAGTLLAAHQDALTAALAAVDLSTTPREPWLDLLLAQRALLEDLREARDRAGTALADLGRDRRGARAWLRELA